MSKTLLTKAGHPRLGTDIELEVSSDSGVTYEWVRCKVVGHLWGKSNNMLAIICEFDDGRGEFPWPDLAWRVVAA